MTKKKFVPLFSEGGSENREAVLLPGRHCCQCLAVRHVLVGNCTNCGRIVCQQEGSGPCYFCGNMVTTAEERAILNLTTNAARKLYNHLKSTPWAPGSSKPLWLGSRVARKRHNAGKNDNTLLSNDECCVAASENCAPSDDEDEEGEEHFVDVDAQTRLEEGLIGAVLQRDRLLHYDATTAKRTKVIDDELDYFVSEGSGAAALWLDPETRKRVAKRVQDLRAQRQALRFQPTGLCIDFTNMTVSEVKLAPKETEERFYDLDEEEGSDCPTKNEASTLGMCDPLLNLPNLQFIGKPLPKRSPELPKTGKNAEIARLHSTQMGLSRVQDHDQHRAIDSGFCLSLHQPWASLLVRGVKTDEGRSWYSAHRGPLWIASTAKVPEKEELREVERIYLERGAKKADLPVSYPTKVLLGCVYVEEVLPQKEYHERFPNGESNSPFVFICSDPRELLIKLPISGQHKIYKLDPHMHAAAKENLT